MAYYQVGPDDADDAVRIRDVVIPPLRRRSSSIQRIYQPRDTIIYDSYPGDQVVAAVEPKKKNRGLFSWLGGDDGCIVSTKRVIEPQQLVYVDDCPWNGDRSPQNHHHHHRHHPSYHHHDHYHRDRVYNQWGDRYQDHYGPHQQQYSSRRSRRNRFSYWDMPWPLTDRDMRRRGERYKNSTECEWREELIDLMAEQREEMAWERHYLDVMPEFEKTNFMYRDTQGRNDRISELTELLEQAREANLERDLGKGLDWEY